MTVKKSEVEEMALESVKPEQARSQGRVVKKLISCPICNERIVLTLEDVEKLEVKESGNGLYPHVHVHGEPNHAVLFYLDKDLNVRNSYGIRSVEIMQIMKDAEEGHTNETKKKSIKRLLRENVLNAKGYGTEFFFK